MEPNNPFENNDDYNPYGNKNNDTAQFSNPFEGESNNNINNDFNPYDDNNNNNGNPFDENNENNPFENDFENNDNYNNNFNSDNNNDSLPSFQNFQESNPYIKKNSNNKDYNSNNNNNMNNNRNNNNRNNNNGNNNNRNNNNMNYNNHGNNYLNNFGGPTENSYNSPPNPFGNNNQYYNNNNNQMNPQDAKRIKAIMDTCESLYNKSYNQYESFDIRGAIMTLCKSIKGLDGLKQTIINKKTSFSSLIPKITSLRNKAFSNLQEYRIMLYLIIPLKFRPVPYNECDPLNEFVKRYLLTEPFITFDDIFDSTLDQNKSLKFVMIDYFKKSQRLGYRCLLLYGPKGSGKTLAVHALANNLGGKVAQIQGTELFKIPYFAKEFIKVSFNYQQFKPLIVYVKNMEEMFSSITNFNFLYDRTTSSKLQNVIFIASTTKPVQMLPKNISEKFHYVHCIRPADKNQKSNYIKFISQKIGIQINMSDQDLNTYAFQNLHNYSNEDIFNLIKTAIELKKKEIGQDEENRVYKEGLSGSDMLKALDSAPGTLSEEEIKYYYL